MAEFLRFGPDGSDNQNDDSGSAGVPNRAGAARPAADVAASESPPLAFTAALNARTPLGVDLSAMTGETVDVINALSAGALAYRLPGVPPGPQARAFELAALPDAGSGPLALAPLEGIARAGAVTPVNDLGQPAAPGAATGLAFSGGAFAQSQAPLPRQLAWSGGWAIALTLRLGAAQGGGTRVWAAMGQLLEGNRLGVTISELSSGALRAVVEGFGQPSVTVTSAPLPRQALVEARLAWDAATGLLQWRVGGAPSGAAASLAFVPEFGGGRLYLGTNLSLATAVNPTGSVHRVSVEATNADQLDSWVPVGSAATLARAEAAELAIETFGILDPVADAGQVSLRFATASGEAGPDLAVAFAGYANVVEQLERWTAAEAPFAPVDLGGTRADRPALLLTAPARGKIETGNSRDYFERGALIPIRQDGLPVARAYISHQPRAGGTNAGQNPAGATPRGFVDSIRIEQDGRVREVTLREMNRPPRMNGGGEAWGAPEDEWVPIHALWDQYAKNNLIFPTIIGESPAVTVLEVPGPGEGFVRVGRTGANLVPGATIAWADLRRLGWWKPGVSAVSAGCRLRLRAQAPGGPDAVEDYRLTITDAPRSAAPALWDQATINFADEATRLRWASRGGDWEGADGPWGVVPFAQGAAITAAGTTSIDVTAMVKAGGPELFLMLSSTGAVTVVPPAMPARPAETPLLRVTGGARAGEYRATRWGLLSDSDSTGWRLAPSAPFAIRRAQPLLLAFDGAGDAAALADASAIELVLTVTSISGGGGAVQCFRPSPRPPRPGARVSVDPTPAAARADLIVKVDSDAEWQAMIANADARNARGAGHPSEAVVAHGCIYSAILPGRNAGLNLLRGFWRAGGGGYERVRFARMVGWHDNYLPMDANRASLPFSGKSPGIIATLDEAIPGIEVGRGGNSVTGFSGWTCRMQHGAVTQRSHANGSALARWLPFGSYDYSMHGDTNGLQTYGVAPLPRMRWLWIETVHAVNSLNPDGSWANDGVFELWVNGRKYAERRRIEYRAGGNGALWDAIWFDEYNGGQDESRVDRPWPFVVGPSYVVAGDAPVAPPAGWAAPFVDASGLPGAPLAYSPDF